MILIFGILLINSVSSAPPVTEVNSDTGYSIWATMHDALQTGEDYEWEVHVSNFTDGMPIVSGITCYAHLYNESGFHLEELEDATASHMFDYTFFFTGGNFTERGQYIIKFNCNNSLLGGGTELNFWVNNYGELLTEAEQGMFNQGMMILFVFLIATIIGCFKVEHYIGKFVLYWASHVLVIMITFSAWQFADGYAMGYLGIAGLYKVLFYFSIIAVIPMIILSLAWIFYIHLFNEHFQKLVDKGETPENAFNIANKKRGGWFYGKK